MGVRERNPALQELFDAGKNVYSFSKLSTIENCPYEAYLNYIKHEQGVDNIYSVMGGAIHDTLEAIMNGEADTSELRIALDEDLTEAAFLGLDFPKDFKGGTSIRDNWIADMTHFCDHFEPFDWDCDTEEFLLYKVDDDTYLQGYADVVKHNQDGTESIYDWKTSSMYNGADLDAHGKQLVLYAMAKEQAGVKIDNIAWVFLKYVTVDFWGKKRANSKEKTPMSKNINRHKIAKELESYIRSDLEEAGFDEIDIEMIMIPVIDKNDLSFLPEEVRRKYRIRPCIVTYPYDDDTKQECLNWIRTQVNEFERRSNDPNDWEPREFTKVNKYGREVEDTFFCKALCGFRKTCQHLADYDYMQEMLNDDLENFL